MSLRSILREACGVLLAALLLSAGCQEQKLSERDLLGLKRQTIQERQGTLSGEEQIRIGTIRASTRSQFYQQVDQILKTRQSGSSGT